MRSVTYGLFIIGRENIPVVALIFIRLIVTSQQIIFQHIGKWRQIGLVCFRSYVVHFKLTIWFGFLWSLH